MVERAAQSVRWARKVTISQPAALALGVLALALALRVPLLGSGQFDYDEGVYWQSLRALADHRLFASVYSSQPPAFLMVLEPMHRLLGGSLLAGRLVVLVLSAGGLVAVYRTLSEFNMSWGGLAGAAVLGADPLFFRQSVTLQAEGPAIGLALMSVAMAAAARTRTGRTQQLLAAGAGALAATAVLTKLMAVAVIPAVAILLALQPGNRRRAAGQLAAAVVGSALAAAAFLLPFGGSWPQLWNQSVGMHLRAREAQSGGLDGWLALREGPLAVLGLAGAAIVTRRARVLAAAGLAWVLGAALLLGLHRPLFPHHLLVLTAPLALLAGGALQLLRDTRKLRHASAVGIVVIGATLASALYVRSLAIPDTVRQPAVSALRAATSHSDYVITDDQYTAALADRLSPPELVDTSPVRAVAGDLTTAQVEAVAERWAVRAVLLDTRGQPSLSLLPGFTEWLVERFQVVLDLGSGRMLYVRSPTDLVPDQSVP